MTVFIKPMLLLSTAALLLSGCFGSDEDDDKKSAVVYVAVGNSLTAGFQSGGLRANWQQASYPAQLAKQMGLEDFELPLIDTPGIGRQKINGKTATPLYIDPATRLITAKALEVTTTSLLSNRSLARPYNNLGVPGATTLDFMKAYDSNTSQPPGNGYFNIVLRGGVLNNSTMLRQAIKQKPTIMTMWLGNNDILGGIVSGTVIQGITVTKIADYSALMELALDTLLRETTAHIFLANIPYITTIPYVTTVPKVVFDPATFQPHSSNTPFLVKEADVEFILLPALAEIAVKKGIPTALGGTGDSLAANLTLSKAEVASAMTLTDGYNDYLKKKADANPTRITLVDINALLNDLHGNKITGLNSKFVLLDASQTAFSLDGIHPNSEGYKHVTNKFIDAINKTLSKNYAKVTLR